MEVGLGICFGTDTMGLGLGGDPLAPGNRLAAQNCLPLHFKFN